MTNRDWLLILSTFFVGMFSGFYVYVMYFSPLYEHGDFFDRVFSQLPFSTTDREGDFSIIGITYGDDETYTYPSFRIKEDGTFSYLYGGTGEEERRNGELPLDLSRDLEEALFDADLVAFAEPVRGKTCEADLGGVSYEYNVEFNNRIYELDTCTSAFNNDTELGEVFLDIWSYF